MKWNKITEKLPEFKPRESAYQTVNSKLVITYSAIEDSIRCGVYQESVISDSGGRIKGYEISSGNSPYVPEYWMELPPPPVKVQKSGETPEYVCKPIRTSIVNEYPTAKEDVNA